METKNLLAIFAVTLLAIGVVMMLTGLIILSAAALNNHEKYECQKWQAEAKVYPGYYLTTWQQMQCEHYNIKIDAPVH